MSEDISAKQRSYQMRSKNINELPTYMVVSAFTPSLLAGYEKSHGKKTNIPVQANILAKSNTYQRLGLGNEATPYNSAGSAQQKVLEKLLTGNNSMYQQSQV